MSDDTEVKPEYSNDPDKPSQLIIAPAKPKLLLKLVLAHQQNMDCKTADYTEAELDAIIGLSTSEEGDGQLVFKIVDENDCPGTARIMRAFDILGYFILDFESYAKTIRAQQLMMARARGGQ
jgi:hypothetical protein